MLKKKIKRKVKYLIIASKTGRVFGAFFPEQRNEAEKYLLELKKEEVGNIKIFLVSNINSFYARIKHAKF